MSKGLLQKALAGGAILLLSATASLAQDYPGGENETGGRQDTQGEVANVGNEGKVDPLPQPRIKRVVVRNTVRGGEPQVSRSTRVTNALVWSTGAYR